jgi:hypothetical protein
VRVCGERECTGDDDLRADKEKAVAIVAIESIYILFIKEIEAKQAW